MIQRLSYSLRIVAAAIAMLAIVREAGMGASPTILTSFTTVTNTVHGSPAPNQPQGYPGPMKPADFQPFFGANAANDPLVKAKNVTVENNSISNISWTLTDVLNPGGAHIMDCVKSRPDPRASNKPFIAVMGLNVKTIPIPGLTISGAATQGLRSVVSTKVDASHSQTVILDSYFTAAAEDPGVACFALNQLYNVGDWNDEALEAIMGEITLLREAQSVQQSNVSVSGSLPSDKFLVYAKLSIYDLNVPGTGIPNTTYYLDNGNLAPSLGNMQSSSSTSSNPLLNQTNSAAPSASIPPASSNLPAQSGDQKVAAGKLGDISQVLPPPDPNASFTGAFSGVVQGDGLPLCPPGSGMNAISMSLFQSGNTVTGRFSAEIPNRPADSGPITNGVVTNGVLTATWAGTNQCSYAITAVMQGNMILGRYVGSGPGLCASTSGMFRMLR